LTMDNFNKFGIGKSFFTNINIYKIKETSPVLERSFAFGLR